MVEGPQGAHSGRIFSTGAAESGSSRCVSIPREFYKNTSSRGTESWGKFDPITKFGNVFEKGRTTVQASLSQFCFLRTENEDGKE